MILLFKCSKTSSEATTWLTKKSSNLEASRCCERLLFVVEKNAELGGNWIVETMMSKVETITQKVKTITMKVETITRKVEKITKNVLDQFTACMKILIWQPDAFAKGCFFVKEIEWGLGGNWIVATITTKVETITKNVLVLNTACMKILICQPNAFAKGYFSVKEIEWGLGDNLLDATK